MACSWPSDAGASAGPTRRKCSTCWPASIETDGETGRRAAGETAGLARQYGLTVYDAAYLELALRRGATLATTDAALAKAARKAGVAVI